MGLRRWFNTKLFVYPAVGDFARANLKGNNYVPLEKVPQPYIPCTTEYNGCIYIYIYTLYIHICVYMHMHMYLLISLTNSLLCSSNGRGGSITENVLDFVKNGWVRAGRPRLGRPCLVFVF